MPKQDVIQRAKTKAREGRAPSTQAGEFVREEMEHIRQGKHGARSTKQAIAIGLSKARKAALLQPPRGKKKTTTGKTRRRSQSRPSARRSRATLDVLKHDPSSAASHSALSSAARGTSRKQRAC